MVPYFKHHSTCELLARNIRRMPTVCLDSGDRCLLLLRWRRGCLQTCILRHHSSKHDAHTLNDANEHTASDSVVSHSFCTTSNREGGTCAEASKDAIPGILLFPTYCPSACTRSELLRSPSRCIAHLMPFTAQSNVENSPPQTPKFPPRTGARALMAVIAPMRRSP